MTSPPPEDRVAAFVFADREDSVHRVAKALGMSTTTREPAAPAKDEQAVGAPADNDAALGMALAQSDEEARRPRQERPRWAQADMQTESAAVIGKQRRCPCGGEVSARNPNEPGGLLGAQWACAACGRHLFEPEVIRAARRQHAAELAHAYARARVRLARAKAAETAAQEAFIAAAADRHGAEQECQEVLGLLELAVQDEVK